MTLYNRNGMLYVRLNGKRISTNLQDTRNNRKLVMSYHRNDTFFQKFNVTKNVPTVLELCEDVLLEKETQLKNTSYRSYISMYKSRIEPFFKDKLVNEIRPITIKEFYDGFKDASSLTTCNAILKEAFQKAIVYEYIESTPFIVKRPRLKSEYKINPFNLDEINLILTHAPKILKNLLGVAFYTGMRTGELIGLKWEDINFQEYTISINRTITVGFIQTPKTKSSKRVIDMLPQAEEFLKAQRVKTGLHEFVFLNSKGKHYNTSNNLLCIWKKLLEDISLKYRNIYQTRHSFASNMLSNGEDMMWVSAMLGHKNANITLEKYTKYIKRQRERKSTFLDNECTKLAHHF